MGIRTWDLRHAIYQLRDITQCLRPLGHHGRLNLALLETKFFLLTVIGILGDMKDAFRTVLTLDVNVWL